MTTLDRSELHLRWLAVGVLAIAIAVAWYAGAYQVSPSWEVVVLLGGLAVVAGNVKLRLPTTVTISPTLILVTAGIAALDDRGAILGSAIISACGGLVFASLRAHRYRVAAYNVGQYALTAIAAATCFDGLLSAAVPIVLTFPATAAVYVAVNVGFCLLAHTVRGRPVGETWADMRQAAISGVVFALLGLLLGELYRHFGPITLVVAVGVAVVAQLVFLAFVRLRAAYQRLELIYRFTGNLQRDRDEGEAITAILEELRQAMDADSAELTVIHGDRWRRTEVMEGHRASTADEGDGAPPETSLIVSGPMQLTELDDGDPDVHLRALHTRLGSHAMVAPLRADDTLIGILSVGHPKEGRTFDREDLRLFETLTNHAAVSLANSRLLGRLRFDSSHDRLTRLPNRTRFNELLEDLPRPSAILLIDLDHFKEINDTLGHHCGDLLLLSVAERIAQEVGHHGIVARLGGDEFGVLLPRTGSSNAVQTAVALLAALEQPFAIDGLELEVTASIGVAIASAGDTDATKLLQQADVAMYSAKEAHSGWELYSSDRDHYSPRRLALAGELRRAIDAGEIDVYYQPKADLRTGDVTGLEALVRWRHPRHGMLDPDTFIPVAESAGLIRPLTLLVLARAVRQQRELQGLGWDLEVAVNLSVRSVLDVHLPDQVARVLEDHGVAPSSLTLEITESSVMADPTRTIGILGRLAALGTNISVDDFGTGYSSLSYLKRLPANEVKIDRTFVAGMLTSTSDAAIVRSTVDLARNLGLRAVAEGVEDEETWSALSDLGCEYAQGYFISRPLPADELIAWLASARRPTGPVA